jgi:hypothetical protein
MLVAGVPDVLALRALEEARRTLPETDVALRSRVASHLSCIPPYTEHADLRAKLVDDALQLAHTSGCMPAVVDALRAKCQLATAPAQIDELLVSAVEIERSSLQLDAGATLLEGHLYRYLALIQLGRIAEADEILNASKCLSARAGGRETAWFIRHLTARREYLAGRLDRAAAGYAELRPRRIRRRGELAELHWLTGEALIHLERGTSAELWPIFVDRTVLWRRRSRALSALALRMLIAQGRYTEAESELDLIPVSRLGRETAGSLGMLSHIALAASALRDTFRCRAAYEGLLPYAGRHAVDRLWFSLGPVSHYLGVLSLALDDPASARMHFEMAVKDSVACGYTAHAAWSRLGWARALAGDRDAASRRNIEALLGEVKRDADEMGLAALLHAVEAFDNRRMPVVP